MSNIVILFGAGASYGAGGIAPEPPPLGAGLFPLLARVFPDSWGNLPDATMRLFGKDGGDFEAGMGALMDHHPMAVAPLQRQLAYLLAQPFIQYPSRCAYVQLANELRSLLGTHSVMVASLNYDLLLEQAFDHAGLPWSYSDGMPRSGHISYNKPHGSSNFLPDNGIQFNRGVSIHAAGVRVNPSIRPRSRSEALQYYQNIDQTLPPAMSFFMPGKASLVTDDLLASMKRGFADAVMKADKVIIVGVRPLVADAHIWGPLKDTPAHVFLCCGPDEFDGWRSSARPSNDTSFLGDRFVQAMEGIIAASR